jgi:hypothetical protein
VESDPSVKASLERKLIELKERHQLNLLSLKDLLSEKKEEEEEEEKDGSKPIRSQISNLVINAAVLSAVALKKSPIPGKKEGSFYVADNIKTNFSISIYI